MRNLPHRLASWLFLAALPAAGWSLDSSGGAAQSTATAREILGQLLALDTTYEKGTVSAVQALRERFLAAGFAANDLVVLAPDFNPAQSDLIVRLRGRGHGRPLLYLCHLDVVAAQAADGTLPPFALTEKDGWLYGRGSQDMKDEDANSPRHCCV